MTKKTYKHLQAALDDVLSQLQSAELDIDNALELYKQGQKLIKELEAYLKTAKNEIDRLDKNA